MEVARAFGTVLRRLRLKARLTQEQLGLEAELRRTYISILELGQQQPSLTTILKISRGLDIAANEVVDLVERELGEAKARRRK